MTEAALLPIKALIRDGEQVQSQVEQQGAKWAFVFLWFFTIAVYARPEDIFPVLGELHLTLFFGCCAGTAYLASLLSGRAGRFWPAELLIVLSLTGWYVAGIPFAFWRGGSFQVLVHVWLKTLFIFFLLTQTLLTLQRIRALLWAIILSELAVTGISILQSSKVVWIGGRMAGFSQGILGWNFLGIAAGITLPYISALFVLRRPLLKSGLLAAACFFMLWMLILTASRSGVLDVVFSLAATTLLVLRSTTRGKVVSVGIMLTLMVAINMAPNVFWERLGTVWGANTQADQVVASAEESTQDHLAVLNRSIQYTLDYPFFGLGLGNFQVANGTELGHPSAWMGTHNTFTEISSEAGLPALLLFIALLVVAMRNMRRVSAVVSEDNELRLMAGATLASLLSFVFGACFAHLAYEYYCFYPLAIAAGIQHIARQSGLDSSPAAIGLSSLVKASE